MGALDELMMRQGMVSPGDSNPQAASLGALARLFAPNMTSIASGEPDPRQFSNVQLPQQGKVPPTDDPRQEGSILEALMLASSAVPAGRAAMGVQGAGRLIPEVMQNAPGMFPMTGKVAGGATLAAILGGDEAGAGEQPFAWQDTNQDRLNRLKQIDTEIARAASAKPSAKSERAQNAQTQMQGKRVDALTQEKNALVGQQQAEQQNALQLYQSAQEKATQEAAAKKSSETSLMDRVPGTRAAIMAASPYASYKFGKTLGSRMSPALSVPTAAGIGALSGATSTAGQNEIDLNTLPESSPTYQRAQAQMSDPNFWMRTGLASAVSGAFGVKGATKGYAGTLPDRTLVNSGRGPELAGPQNTGSSTTPTLSGSAGTPASPIPQPKVTARGSYEAYTTQSGDKVVQTPHGWQGVHPDTGKWGFVKKPDGPLEKLMSGSSQEQKSTGGGSLEQLITPKTRAAAREQPYDPAVMVDGKVFRGSNHGDAAERAAMANKTSIDSLKIEDGFIDPKSGAFITRAEAYRRSK